MDDKVLVNLLPSEVKILNERRTDGKNPKFWIKYNNEEILLINIKNIKLFFNSFIASNILKKLGINVAEYRLYELNGKICMGTKTFLKENDIMDDLTMLIIKERFETADNNNFHNNDKANELFNILKQTLGNLLIQNKEGNGNAAIITNNNKQRVSPIYDLEHSFDLYCYFNTTFVKDIEHAFNEILQHEDGLEFIKACCDLDVTVLDEYIEWLTSEGFTIPQELIDNQKMVLKLSLEVFNKVYKEQIKKTHQSQTVH